MSSEEKIGDANNGETSSVSEEESVDELSLLKKELEKPKGKPTPRKKRYRKQPTRK